MAFLTLRSNGKTFYLNSIAWAAYTILLFIVIRYHEPWFDEAQAWLLARDTKWWDLIAHYLRYEGSPGLWHYLLRFLAKNRLPYESMNVLAGLIASGGAALFIFCSPFPAWIRYLFPFSYFMFYQYGVIARSYVLIPLCLFGIAVLYTRAPQRTFSLVLLLAALANVSLHGLLFSGAISIAFALQMTAHWPQLPWPEKRRYLLGAALLLVVAALIVLQLQRPPDLMGFGDLSFGVKHLIAVTAIKLKNAFTESYYLTIPILAISAWWFYKRKTLVLFLLGTSFLSALAAVAYSNVWHEGLLLIWWAFTMWISWPPGNEQAPKAVALVWAVLLVIQIFWSAQATRYDLRYPYSGSKELAAYLHSHHLEREKIYAYGFKSIAILPYFRHNVFANYDQAASFWRWSNRNSMDSTFNSIPQGAPQLVVLSTTLGPLEDMIRCREALGKFGYHLVGRFDGALYWKSAVMEPESYDLYQLNGQPAFGKAGLGIHQ